MEHASQWMQLNATDVASVSLIGKQLAKVVVWHHVCWADCCGGGCLKCWDDRLRNIEAEAKDAIRDVGSEQGLREGDAARSRAAEGRICLGTRDPHVHLKVQEDNQSTTNSTHTTSWKELQGTMASPKATLASEQNHPTYRYIGSRRSSGVSPPMQCIDTLWWQMGFYISRVLSWSRVLGFLPFSFHS